MGKHIEKLVMIIGLVVAISAAIFFRTVEIKQVEIIDNLTVEVVK